MDIRKFVILFAGFVASLVGCGARSDLEFVAFPADAGASVSDARVVTDAGVDCASRPIQPGDLIRCSDPTMCGPAVYYIGRDGSRHVFPNEDTFYSWYPNFSEVCWRPFSQIIEVPIRGNVTIRPGTFLVKIVTDPTVYAISPCGRLHAINTEEIAIALYGRDWARRVRDLPDAFFINYVIGARIETPVHPDGTLLTYVGSSDVYVMDGGRRRRFAPGAFEANGFQRFYDRDPSIRFIVETTIVYPDGSPVTGREPTLADTICESL